MNKFINAAMGVIIITGFALAACAQAQVPEDHPHLIQRAMVRLQNAKNDLTSNWSGDEYGGHKAEALEHINAALQQLNAALVYADNHPGDVQYRH